MISPRLNDFGLFDFHRAEELIQRGEQAASRHIDDILREIDARDLKRNGPKSTGPAKLTAASGF